MYRALLLSAAAMAWMPSTASAQEERAIADLAVELAYDLCPAYADEDIALEGPEFAAAGLKGPVKSMAHPRFGELRLLELTRTDGLIAFAGSDEIIFCQVQVQGPSSAGALAKLKEGMPRLGFALQRDTENSFDRDGIAVETFRAPAEGGLTAFVQFVRGQGPRMDMAAFQFVILEEDDGTSL